MENHQIAVNLFIYCLNTEGSSHTTTIKYKIYFLDYFVGLIVFFCRKKQQFVFLEVFSLGSKLHNFHAYFLLRVEATLLVVFILFGALGTHAKQMVVRGSQFFVAQKI